MPLHRPNQVRVGRRLKLVFRDFLDAINQALTRGTVENGLGVGRTELEVGDDVSRTDPDRESLIASRGAYGLAMTGDKRGTFRHKGLPTLKKLLRATCTDVIS